MNKPKRLKRVVIKEELVALTGHYICALALQQFLYWSERTGDYDDFMHEEKERNPDAELNLTHGWIYKSIEELHDELMLGKSLSPRTLSRRLEEVVDKGFLSVRKNPKFKWDHKLQYRPDIHKIQTELQKIGYALDNYPLLKTDVHGITAICHRDKSNGHRDKTIPETTTEITQRVSPKKVFGEAAPDSDLEDFLGPNPRQAEIDEHKNSSPKMAPAELMLVSLGAGKTVPREVIRMREEGWNIKDHNLELAIAVFVKATGSVLPTVSSQRGLWEKGGREHLEETVFEGQLERLYQKVWDQVKAKVKLGELTMSHPRAFSRMMYQVVNLETSINKTKITTAILLSRMEAGGVIRLEKGGDKAQYVWVESGDPVQKVPREIIQQYL